MYKICWNENYFHSKERHWLNYLLNQKKFHVRNDLFVCLQRWEGTFDKAQKGNLKYVNKFDIQRDTIYHLKNNNKLVFE